MRANHTGANLMLVHHTRGQALFVDLPIVDLLLHRAGRHQSIHMHRPHLSSNATPVL